MQEAMEVEGSRGATRGGRPETIEEGGGRGVQEAMEVEGSRGATSRGISSYERSLRRSNVNSDLTIRPPALAARNSPCFYQKPPSTRR